MSVYCFEASVFFSRERVACQISIFYDIPDVSFWTFTWRTVMVICKIFTAMFLGKKYSGLLGIDATVAAVTGSVR